MVLHVERIVSGGQTGVDRGALDAAISLKIPHGGWCPRGRRAEDGRIPMEYELRETDSVDYTQRTEQNVVDSDATLILYRARLHGGTKLTHKLARQHGKPFLLVDLEQCLGPQIVRDWLQTEQVGTLNVAGPRESGAEGITEQTRKFVVSVFGPNDTQ